MHTRITYRYVRELNFARRKLFQSLGLWSVCLKFKLNFVIQAQTIRYRKELKCWDRYFIKIKILCWNNKDSCFYIESRFEDKTGFVVAIHHAKYRVIGPKNVDKVYLMPSYILQLADLLPKTNDKSVTDPEIPDFLLSWIESQNQSSRLLNPNKN